MSTLSFLLATHTSLSGDEVAHLQRLASEWQLLSDLSFADFLLWVPVTSETGEPYFLCVAHSRPTTAPTAHPEDMVGGTATAAQHPQLRRALGDATMRREEQPRWHRGRSIRREVVPVGHGPGERGDGGGGKRVIAVLGRDTNLAAPRVPSTLEISYLAVAGDLCQMIADGTFPAPGGDDEGRSSPRVGDGLVRVSTVGTILYVSPNAASAFHRLGWTDELVGADLPTVARRVSADPFEGAETVTMLRDALAGTPSARTEIESRGATAVVRALPLRPRGVPAGALVLVRDVTEVRRRDRALMSKDATIREIHHRVKNNLQTVAALLRLQARRTRHEEARSALSESMRRVASIALVHESLAASVDERVDIDEVLAGVVPMMNDLVRPGTGVELRREGRAGVLPAVMATPLVLVVTELVSNALEHGFPVATPQSVPGTVRIVATRTASLLQIDISDDGLGLPETFSLERAPGLGLQIVRTLVDSELGGTLSLRPDPDGGTRAELRIPLNRR
ncbi:sensor histidine kinase [Actinomycetospora atypica]|uniref:histidine kinase n=1 Tax=Actinomycetospora atypica TaxID=1290095 RepID=A0ABV9YL82_9PSEU